MKVVLQRCKKAAVSVNEVNVGQVDRGLVLLVCFERGDNIDTIQKAVKKICSLRVFNNPDSGKFDHSIIDIKGSILAISQFTLSWDGKKGNRPSFDKAMEPRQAAILFKTFLNSLSERVPTETGTFGEEMQVSLINDGPVTFHLSY